MLLYCNVFVSNKDHQKSITLLRPLNRSSKYLNMLFIAKTTTWKYKKGRVGFYASIQIMLQKLIINGHSILAYVSLFIPIPPNKDLYTILKCIALVLCAKSTIDMIGTLLTSWLMLSLIFSTFPTVTHNLPLLQPFL